LKIYGDVRNHINPLFHNKAMAKELAMNRLAVTEAPAQKRWSATEAISRFLARVDRLVEPPMSTMEKAMAINIPREVAAEHLGRKFGNKLPIFDMRQ
jgi:hypothetical protein